MEAIKNIREILVISLIIIFVIIGSFIGFKVYNEYLIENDTGILDSLAKQRLELIDINIDLDTIDINIDSIKDEIRASDYSYNKRLDTIDAKLEIIYEEVNKSKKTLAERIIDWFN